MTSPRRAAIVLAKAEPAQIRAGSPQASLHDPRRQHTTRQVSGHAAASQAIRQQSMPMATGFTQMVNKATRQTSQPPFAGACTPETNYREVRPSFSGVHDSRSASQQGSGSFPAAYAKFREFAPLVDNSFISEIDSRAAPATAACSTEELNIAIRGVMQTIEEERAVRSNEMADLRREMYEVIYREREAQAREFKELKSEVATQHSWFTQEIIRRSVYEARLQNEVDQTVKEPQELSSRVSAFESQLESLSAEMGPLRSAMQNVQTPVLGPEVLSDPRLVELMVSATDTSLRVIQQQIHEIVGHAIEEHLGKVDDADSLFGMVREALSGSRHLSDELKQVQEVVRQTTEKISGFDSAGMAQHGEERSCVATLTLEDARKARGREAQDGQSTKHAPGTTIHPQVLQLVP